MAQQLDIVWQQVPILVDVFGDASHNFLHAKRLGSQCLGEQFEARPRIDASAREDVDCCVALLGPGVDGHVRLGDDDRAADSLWCELVEDLADHRHASPHGRLDHPFADCFRIVQQPAVATVEFSNQMSSNSVQGRSP